MSYIHIQIYSALLDEPLCNRTINYNAAIQHCIKKEYSFTDINLIFDRMSSVSVSRDILTYNHVLRYYARYESWNKTWNCFQSMTKQENIRPNITTFNRLFKCLRVTKNDEPIEQLFHQMNEFLITANLQTFSELLLLYSAVISYILCSNF